jgi:hypothetical protein
MGWTMSSDVLSIDGVEQCPNCRAFHTDNTTGRWIAEVCKTFDPNRPCKLCGERVCGLSLGGPEICPLCDAGYPPAKRPQG